MVKDWWSVCTFFFYYYFEKTTSCISNVLEVTHRSVCIWCYIHSHCPNSLNIIHATLTFKVVHFRAVTFMTMPCQD